MSIEQRVESLERRHADIDARVEEEQRRPLIDNLRLLELKRQKLAIKDEIMSLAVSAPST